MAVVILGIIGGVGDDGAEAKTQGKENLRGCLPPHLHVSPDFQLEMYSEQQGRQGSMRICLTSLHSTRHFICGYLGVEHVGDSLQGPIQKESSDKEAEQNHIGEDGGEIHHLESEKE